ncbi:MAG: hypothetical protein ACFCBU_04465 [Cyanophyceae cyanobacterium]
MFAEFRSRSPTGCLVSKMLEFTQGQYVVSVAVEQDGQVLATGMAAADTLEEAEDRARVRALEAFGLVAIDYDGSVTLLGGDSSSALPSNALPSNNRPIAQLAGTASAEPPLTETIPRAEATEVIAETAEVKEPPKTASPSPQSSVNPPAPTTPSSSPPASKKSAPKKAAPDIPGLDFADPPPAPSPEPPAPSPKAELPVDLSDAIAQIGLLMEQVGWDKKQGVAYLQETYGKRTRAELTDQELMTFLGHLQTLVQKDLDF